MNTLLWMNTLEVVLSLFLLAEAGVMWSAARLWLALTVPGIALHLQKLWEVTESEAPAERSELSSFTCVCLSKPCLQCSADRIALRVCSGWDSWARGHQTNHGMIMRLWEFSHGLFLLCQLIQFVYTNSVRVAQRLCVFIMANIISRENDTKYCVHLPEHVFLNNK